MIFVLWVILAILVGVFAASRGRSGIGFTLASLVFSPIIGFIFVIATKNLAAGPAGGSASDATHVRCTKCAEFVLPEAVVCKHCGAELTPQPRHLIDQRLNAKQDRENLAIGIGAIAFLILMAALISKCTG